MWLCAHNYNNYICFPASPFYNTVENWRLPEELNITEPISFQRTHDDRNSLEVYLEAICDKRLQYFMKCLEMCTYRMSWVREGVKASLLFHLVILFNQVSCQPSIQETQFLSLISTWCVRHDNTDDLVLPISIVIDFLPAGR